MKFYPVDGSGHGEYFGEDGGCGFYANEKVAPILKAFFAAHLVANDPREVGRVKQRASSLCEHADDSASADRPRVHDRFTAVDHRGVPSHVPSSHSRIRQFDNRFCLAWKLHVLRGR